MRALAFAIGLLLALLSPACAEERITNFISDVTVNTDASLTVRETIEVMAEGNEIRRGILRDFPTVYPDRNGTRVAVGFEVIEVKRNGNPEPFAMESISNGKRIRIGDKDVLLGMGVQRYQITYRTTRQLGFFDDFDELYWNVTGNGWTFPIEQARTIIRLPEGARIRQHAAYTGYQGDDGRDFRVNAASENRYDAETTRRLNPSEGFTVAVAWQKGIVAAPTDSEKWGWWISDNAGVMALALSLMASAAFYFYAWDRVGRDPAKGTIIPIFTPPAGLGPAGARYITKHDLDDRGFAAAIVSLAVKGRLKIADDDDTFSITKLSAPKDMGRGLTRAEQALLNALPNGTTVLKQSNHMKVRGAKNTLENALAEEYEGTIFLRNIGWFWKGLAVSIAGLILAALMLPAEEGIIGLFAVGWAGIWWSVVLGVAWAALKGLLNERGVMRKVTSIFTLMFLIPFFGGGLIGPGMIMFGAGSPGLYMLVGTAVALGVMNLVFFHLLRAPTEPGRRLLDQLEGFRMYLATAEEDRLNVLHPPEKTPELFERYLPYALALDCENEWNAKFSAVLAAAALAGASAPSWYSGRNWDAGRTGSFTDSLGSSLSSSVASASTAPGKSSGSSGGGSSGGGGGGGGGSGW
jgi:uncharacterized membrane protein YgcG